MDTPNFTPVITLEKYELLNKNIGEFKTYCLLIDPSTIIQNNIYVSEQFI